MALIKVCGARTPGDVRMLAEAGVDLVGLWHGVPGGPHELPARQVAALARVARGTGRLQPVLVTFSGDVAELLEIVAATGVRTLQLHAYQHPAVVRALKAAVPDLTVIKVLHVRGTVCLARRFIDAYTRAGVDSFLLDSASEDGRIGSTGLRLPTAAVLDLADELHLPFLLAGGVSAACRPDDRLVAAHPRFAGIDVDSSARGPDGRLAAGPVRAIRLAWAAGQVATVTPAEATA